MTDHKKKYELLNYDSDTTPAGRYNDRSNPHFSTNNTLSSPCSWSKTLRKEDSNRLKMLRDHTRA